MAIPRSSAVPRVLDSLLLRMAGARVVVLFLFHAAVFTISYLVAYLVRFEFAIPRVFIPTFRSNLVVVVGVQLLTGLVFGFYRGWWRYVGIADVVRLVGGLTTALGVLLAGWYLWPETPIEERWLRSPRGVLLIDWAFALLALFGARVMIRLARDRFRPQQRPAGATRRVLIIGAGDAGETLAREIEHRPQLGMKVAGFIDDHQVKIGSHIRGIEVFGPIARTGELAESLDADEALIAIPSASGSRIREIIHHLSSAGIRFKTIPGIDHLVSGRVTLTELRPVNVEDLLRREQIVLPGDPVRKLFRGKRILVTGAGGTIGNELASQVLAFEPASLALVERSEYALYEVRKRLSREHQGLPASVGSHLLDITDAALVEALVEQLKPEIVLHAAAHKHVPLGEENPLEYLRNNALATRSVAEICMRHGVDRFVMISTDKAINPSSVMGATKRAAEILLLDLARDSRMKISVVRFGNVIGSSGSVIPLFMEQIAAGGPLTVTDPEVTRYFIRTSEAISLVLQAATIAENGRVFMLDMGEPIRIVDLARDLIRLSSQTEDEIQIVFTGLRPGEKLFEEIRLHGESVRPTPHPQIVITEAPQPSGMIVHQWIASTSGLRTSEDARQSLRRLIPEYAQPELRVVERQRDASALQIERAVTDH